MHQRKEGRQLSVGATSMDAKNSYANTRRVASSHSWSSGICLVTTFTFTITTLDVPRDILDVGFTTTNRVLASPYVNFGCDYCKVTYHRLADALEHQECCKEQKRSKRHFPYLGHDAFKKRLKVSCDRTITLIELEKSKK